MNLVFDCFDCKQGHQQSENINHANKEASMEILMANNPELGNSNTLDLHGLYIKEALDILKRVMYEKKQGKRV